MRVRMMLCPCGGPADPENLLQALKAQLAEAQSRAVQSEIESRTHQAQAQESRRLFEMLLAATHPPMSSPAPGTGTAPSLPIAPLFNAPAPGATQLFGGT